MSERVFERANQDRGERVFERANQDRGERVFERANQDRGADEQACITCGDVAVALEVVTVDGGDAVCRADDGGTEVVAIELVAPVGPGDRVLVHARVAIEKLASAP